MKTILKRFLVWLALSKKERIMFAATGEMSRVLSVTTSLNARNHRAIALTHLRPEEAAFIRSLEKPYRWMPDKQLTPAEGKQWEAFVGSPLGTKIDQCIINWAAQQAQAAIAAPADQIQTAAGFARGCMAGWQLAKTLSRLVATEGDNSETDATTTAAGLDQFQP